MCEFKLIVFVMFVVIMIVFGELSIVVIVV